MTKIVPFKDMVRRDAIIERFADVVGQNNARSYLSSVSIAVANSPALQKCDPVSIISAALQAASLRMSCDPQMRQAALVPFKGKAVLIPMYKGLYDLAVRTGKYRYINTAPLYQGETIEFDRITGAAKLGGHKSGDEIIGWIASFQMYEGLSKTIYWTVEEIHNHAKQYSAGYSRKDGAWQTNPRDMERKTVLRQLLTKWAYLDPNDKEMLEAIETRPFEQVNEDEYTTSFVTGDVRDLDEHHDYDADEAMRSLGFEADEPQNVLAADPARPFSLEELQAYLQEQAQTKAKLSEGKAKVLPRNLEMLFAGHDDPTACRKLFTKWVFGKTSTTKLTNGEAYALSEWVNVTQDPEQGWLPDFDSVDEAMAVIAFLEEE